MSFLVLFQSGDKGKIPAALPTDEEGVIGFELMRNVDVSLEIISVEERL